MALINTEVTKKVEGAQVALNSAENNVDVSNETIAIVEENKVKQTTDLSSDESNIILETLQNETQVEIDYEQYAIDQIEQDLLEAQEQLKAQEEADGWVNDIWNGLKEFTGIGVSKSEVESAIENQEVALEKLKETKINGNFSEVYEEITGQKYDETKLMQCHQAETILGAMESDLGIILNNNESDEVKQGLVNDYLLKFQNETGLSYEDLSATYKELSNTYLGTSNELTNVLNNYVDSQSSFVDKTAQVVQIGGMGMMILGGVACFIPGGQIIGAGMMKAGQMMALAGTFGDNSLEAEIGRAHF